ncbi:MAG: alkaline phosphatase PhoX [Marinibacterium sp.]
MFIRHLLGATALATGFAGAALAADMVRIGTVPYKAEVTGILVNAGGELFFNAQHPNGKGEASEEGAAIIGYVAGTDFNDYDGPGIAIPPEDARDVVHAAGDYVILGTAGDKLGDGTVLGGVYDAAGDLMFVSNDADYNAFVRIDDNNAYLYTAFEGASRKGVSTISRLKLERGADGRWQTNLAESKSIDLGSIEGGWVLCFGAPTPWGTELLAEEYYFFNTALWNHPNNHDADEKPGFAGGNDVSYHMPKMMDAHLGRVSNPYMYGYMIEMGDLLADQPDLTRRFAMGRFSHENGIVMGDGRTVYMSDDDSPKYTDAKYNSNSGGVFFKFVADHPRDLSSGTLYAAKATQDPGTDPHTTGFTIDWVELAHGNDAEIAGWIAEYDGIGTDQYVEGQSSYLPDADVWNWAEGKTGQDLNGDGTVGSYPDDRPAFLESRKAAAALGATYEWNKMEGVAADGENVYLSMSEVAISMDAGWGHAPWDTGARDEAEGGVIALAPEACGIVYAAPIGADYDITRLEPSFAGKAGEAGCDPDRIANPDNVAAFSGGLLIAEDAGPKMHPVDMLWLVRN